MANISNTLNFESVQIKNSLIDKLANETKINEFIREYFRVSERRIFDVYEGLVNFFLKTDELGKFKEDFKVFVEEDSGFLLDKIFSGYAIDEHKLQELFFDKMNLKKDKFWHKWVYVFTRSIFQHGIAEKFFETLKELNNNWRDWYYGSLITTMRKMIGLSVVNLIKDEVVKELVAQTEGSSKKDVEENYSVIIEGMVNKRIIERNYWTIVTKMVEYFKAKNIKLDLLFKEYQNFFDMIFNTNFLEVINQQYQERQKSSPLTKSFVKLIANKQNILFDSSNKVNVQKELLKLIPEKSAKGYIALAQKSPVLFKQQIATDMVYEMILEDLKLCKQEYLNIKNKTLDAKTIATNILDTKNKNLFYNSLNHLLNGYDKEEKNNKIKALIKDIDSSYDINSFFDDLFLKIAKFEEMIPFWWFDEQWVAKTTKDITWDIFLSKEEKLEKIIEVLEHNYSIISTLGKLFKNQEYFKLILRNKQEEILNKQQILILDYLLKAKETLTSKVYKQRTSIGMTKAGGDFMGDSTVCQLSLYEYLLDIKDYAVHYDLSHLGKKALFVDKFFSPQWEEANHQLKNFLKIWLLANNLWPYLHIAKIFFKENEYLGEIEKLYNFWNTLKLYQNIERLKTDLDRIEDKFAHKKDKGTTDVVCASIQTKLGTFAFWKWWKLQDKLNQIKKGQISENLNQMLGYTNMQEHLNPLSKDFLSFIEKNQFLISEVEEFDNYLQSSAEIDMIYGIFHLINTQGVTVEAHNDYVLVYFRNKIFVFFSTPNFTTLNNISLYLESKKDFEHVFIYTHVNFYLYLTSIFRKNINVKGMQQNFKQLLLLSFYDDDISDITIFGDKDVNICYFLVRKKGKYQMLWFKKVDFVQTVFSFSVMDAVIDNIIALNGAITSEKQSDTSIKFGGINYRIGVMKDGNRIGIVMRKAQNAWLDINIKRFMDESSLVYQNKVLPYKKEGFSLYDTYDEEDVKVMLDYVAQTSWMIIISGSTGSGKSVSMRNFLNHVFESTLKNNYWKKIATFEDPIEAGNPNFMQFEFKKAELPSAVLGIKRADLDVALVGEIRDYSMIAGMLEASDVIATKTTMHSPTVWSALFLLKKWAIAGKVDLVDIIYAIKILMAQKLSFYMKEKYQSPEQQEYQIGLGNIVPVLPWSIEEKELITDLNFLTRGTLGKDIDYNELKRKYLQDENSVSEYQRNVLKTEELSVYLFKELIKKGTLKYVIKDAVARRKVYYEMIDRVKMKLEFNLMYSVLTGENIIGRPIREDEADINKLMIKLLRKTREQRALEDFFKGYLDWNNLSQYSKEYFILVLHRMFEKNGVKSYADIDKFIEKLENKENIL